MIYYTAIVHLLSSDTPTKATADLILNDSLCLSGFSIVETVHGLAVLFPHVHPQGVIKTFVQPLHPAVSQEIVDKILTEYHALVESTHSNAN